jgi:hypothetical protein
MALVGVNKRVMMLADEPESFALDAARVIACPDSGPPWRRLASESARKALEERNAAIFPDMLTISLNQQCRSKH